MSFFSQGAAGDLKKLQLHQQKAWSLGLLVEQGRTCRIVLMLESECCGYDDQTCRLTLVLAVLVLAFSVVGST